MAVRATLSADRGPGAARYGTARLSAVVVLALSAGTVQAYVLHPNVYGWNGGAGNPATITYSFMATGLSMADCNGGTSTALGDFVAADWKSEIVAALDSWTAVCGVTFVEVADSGLAFNAVGATNGDIRICGEVFDGPFNVLAHGYYPPPNGWTAAGDVHFDIAEDWQTPLNPGGSINFRTVAAHEFGHSLGFMHTGVANSLMNAFYNPAITAPQADEIAGGQAVYGESGTAPEPTLLAFLVVPALATYVTRRR